MWLSIPPGAVREDEGEDSAVETAEDEICGASAKKRRSKLRR
jgi:hypothetical protein